ncbi:MAG: MFS transporter, partial [Geminicoccaceae bacterium]|nr:MFS transporter [Geminicoccaceae bacterium]
VAGGLLYGLSATTAYSIAVLFFIAAGLLVTFIPRPPRRMTAEPVALQTILAGFSYIWREPVVLGAISLDLFAVLLGGAVALMPVYARDILDLGPWGLGLLRAAPGVGAILVGFWLAFHPLRDHAGIILLVFVGLFGLATAIFGLSTTTWISILALLFVGGCDMVSVYIRETMIQIWTPDALRGRVNAVNMVFVGASNELGEFRAGAMAAWIGTVAAVSLGGIATLSVALLWARLFPDMRRIRHLDGRH